VNQRKQWTAILDAIRQVNRIQKNWPRWRIVESKKAKPDRSALTGDYAPHCLRASQSLHNYRQMQDK